ncbi:hypothetical protein [Terrimonas pollutisoli]|uniref:hypothetical protein n=1 Tax=Terrimonas pollutisoli TaxID=3034147 RepID=UPI0023ECE8F5|nr:hypothetical protein [Terrimonas sp. H1YJ31]
MHNKLFQLKSALLLVVLSLHFTCLSQKDENKINIDNFDVSTISISFPDEKIKLPIPVTSIRVYDSRFDTSCLGIIKNGVSSRLRLLKSRRNLRHELKAFFTHLADPILKDSVDVELCCFVKKLILSDHIVTDVNEEKKLSAKKYDTEENGGLLFIAEFYAWVNNYYIPLCRFDTILGGDKNIIRGGDQYLQDALKASLQKVATVNWEKAMLKNNKLSRDKISEYNNTRFNLAILNSHPAKGIYRNFEDFKNNTPLPIEYTLDKNKTGDFLYVKNEKGEDTLYMNLWGYSDGKDMFIFSASNFFKLHRSNNGFKIYGAKDFTSKRNLRANFGLIDLVSPNSNYSKSQTRSKYYLIKSFFILDMETGELY